MILHIVFIMLLTVSLCLCSFILLGGIVYDFKQTKLRKKEKNSPNTRVLRKRPLVSIVVVSNNDPAELEKCLFNIARNDYKKWEIIVVRPTKSNVIKNTIDKFSGRYPSKKIKLVISRKKSIQKIAMANANGSLVLAMNSSYILDRAGLHKGVRYFALNSDAINIKPDYRILNNYTISGLLGQFDNSLSSVWQKCKASFNFERDGNLFFYRPEGLLQKSTKQKTIPRYCSDMLIYRYPSGSYALRKPQISYNNAIGLILFMAVSYFVYLAISHHYNILLALAWVVGFSYLLLCIWSDEQLGFSKKVGMLFLAPLACALFYLSSLTNIFVSKEGRAGGR
jgi:hypothetical protein